MTNIRYGTVLLDNQSPTISFGRGYVGDLSTLHTGFGVDHYLRVLARDGQDYDEGLPVIFVARLLDLLRTLARPGSALRRILFDDKHIANHKSQRGDPHSYYFFVYDADTREVTPKLLLSHPEGSSLLERTLEDTDYTQERGRYVIELSIHPEVHAHHYFDALWRELQPVYSLPVEVGRVACGMSGQNTTPRIARYDER